jgi:hypothetical protein
MVMQVRLAGMEIDASPALSEGTLSALRSVLLGTLIASESGGGESAWWRAAVREAVDREPNAARYALSRRSTRGATRA